MIRSCLFLSCLCLGPLFAQPQWGEQHLLNTNAATDDALDDQPKIATDGQGVWVTVWSSEAELNGSGGDSDLFVSRSLDNGLTWSDPELLNTNGDSDSGFDIRPTIAFGGDRFIVVWTSSTDLGGIGTDGDLFLSVSTDLGQTWTAPEVVNQSAETDSRFDWDPHLATNGQGNWMLAWYTDEPLDGSGSDTDIFIATSNNHGATWTAPAVLTNFMRSDSGNDFTPIIATDGAGVWGLVFDSVNSLNDTIGTDTDVLYVRSLDNGFSWSEPVPINSDAAGDINVDNEQFIATDGSGNWLITWSSDDDNIEGIDWEIWCSVSADHGQTWSNQILINGDGDVGSDFSSVIANTGPQSWTVVWSNVAAEVDVYAASSDDNGLNWFPTVNLRMDAAQESTSDSEPAVAGDGQGYLVAVWKGAVQPEGGSDFDLLTATAAPPPACELSQAFYSALPDWPTTNALTLVGVINAECTAFTAVNLP